MSWQRRGTYRAIDTPILSDFPVEADLQSLSLRSAKIYFPNPIDVISTHSSLSSRLETYSSENSS